MENVAAITSHLIGKCIDGRNHAGLRENLKDSWMDKGTK